MLRSLYIARTGLDVQQTQLDVISNNLANVSTTGYKKTRAVFEDLLYQNIRQAGAQSSQQTQLPSGFQLGVGARTVATERIHTQGTLQETGNSLDVAINGRGFFQILMPDGTTAYTRDGSFQVDSNGNLVTASGYQVIPNMVIPSDTLAVAIARDGTVSITQANNTTPTVLGQLQLATFINPTGLQSQGENLYVETASSGTPQLNNPGDNGVGVLNQSFVESSNVNVAEELINMIVAQRAYELNSRAITTSDQMLQRLTQI
ncbi:flagellar basal-body rod protein FlgG [Parasulfuritortus cantonensis]|uniref:Flagellar basal-body rod protein FlgG n=1 Tax=Parasulfuritortus cantonensis TaxID=2528202 RepID=A0A4R1BEF7_9PROT|nr:flagellar basal-body rod protein FlgG [Parasulfuritortus cantonensis]TCJ15536.1 flagellar basal-body rod protein FlgG [Parasulfuritortus cantonensis]